MEMKTPEEKIELLQKSLVERGWELQDSVDDVGMRITGLEAGDSTGAHPDQGENDDLPGRYPLRHGHPRQGPGVRAATAITRCPE